MLDRIVVDELATLAVMELLDKERMRVKRLSDAMAAIARKRVMNTTSAINMRAIALGALAIESRS